MARALYFVLMLVCFNSLSAPVYKKSPVVMVDVGHGQRLFKDPKSVDPKDKYFKRIQYLRKELLKSVESFDGELVFSREAFNSENLKKVDVLFIHVPKQQYSKKELLAIEKFVKKGGSLFLAMEVDYWSTLKQTNVNDILKPFDIHFEGKIPDSLSGGYTGKSPVTKPSIRIPYHGGRIVKGGTPFCYRNESKAFPFGVYKKVSKGKVIAMGDGMSSLYMTSWKDVHDYQCQDFMQDVFKWLMD